MQDLNIKKYIRVSKDVKKELATKYKVSMPLVSMALNYETKDGRSKWIRIDALQNGGVICYDLPQDTLIKVAKGEVKLPCIID